MFLKKEVSMTRCAVGSLKLAVAAFAFGLIKLWPAARDWVYNTNIWWFVGAFVLFSIPPMTQYFGCCKVKKKK